MQQCLRKLRKTIGFTHKSVLVRPSRHHTYSYSQSCRFFIVNLRRLNKALELLSYPHDFDIFGKCSLFLFVPAFYSFFNVIYK
jgi:phenylalanine-4-hydroxylase